MNFTRIYNQTNYITSLRAIAIMMVILIHYGGFGLREISPQLNVFVDWGKYGVALFFVISGFTIFNQIFIKNYSFSSFIKVRFLRLSLPYFPIVILLWLLPESINNGWTYKYTNGMSLENLLFHLTFLNFVSLEYSNTILGVEWTLSIEFFYYIFFASLIFYSQFKKLPMINTTILLILFFGLYNIGETLQRWHVSDPLTIHWSPITYGYMFALGGLSVFVRREVLQKYSDSELNYFSDRIIILSVIFIGHL